MESLSILSKFYRISWNLILNEIWLIMKFDPLLNMVNYEV